MSTNAGFDDANDDKGYGTIPPNDGQCHLDTQSTVQGFPSISQLDSIVKSSQVSVIFAVTSSQRELYENLSKQVAGSSNGILADDSSNVAELVRSEYNVRILEVRPNIF